MAVPCKWSWLSPPPLRTGSNGVFASAHFEADARTSEMSNL